MPDTPTQTTDRELLALAGHLREAYQQAEPGYRLLAAAQAADEWARERYGVSIELLRQHREQQEEIDKLRHRWELERNAVEGLENAHQEQASVAIESTIEAAQLRQQAESLTELLASLEWRGAVVVYRGEEPYRVQSCPSCRGLSPHQHPPWMNEFAINWGHKPDCALKAALEGREADLCREWPAGESTMANRSLEDSEDRAEVDAGNEADDYDATLDQYVDQLQERAASLADRVMVAEGERDQLQERVAELQAEQDRMTIYYEQYNKSLMDECVRKVRDYTHQAEQAETYRRLYAQTLAELEEVQGGERFESKPAAGVAWADWSKLRPGDEGYLPLNLGGSACGAEYPNTPNGQPLHCTRHEHDDRKHVAHGIDKDGRDYQIVAWREVQHGE